MGNYTDYFPAASGGGGVCPTYAIHTNCTGWVPPRDGCVLFHIFGAGSGGKSQAYDGGGAGAYIRKAESVTTSQCYCALIGTSAIPNGSYTMICQIGGGWCMVAHGACCYFGGMPCYFGATPNGTNETYTCGGCGGAGGGGGGAVHIFGDPGTSGYTGGSNSGCGGGGGGAGVGGTGANARAYCCGVVPGGGGGSGDSAHTAANLNDGSGQYTSASQGGQPLWIIDTPFANMFKWVPCWGEGGSIRQTGNPYWTDCRGLGLGYSVTPGIGGGGSGGGYCWGGQHAGPFAGGGAGNSQASGGGPGGMGGFPGGGAGGAYWNCCFCTRGGDGAIFIEYLEV